MILLIDVGNTNIVFGVSDGEKIINTLRTETVKDADFDYVPILQDLLCKKEKIGKVDGVIISSVVPEVTGKLENAIVAIYGIQSVSADTAAKKCLVIDIDFPDKL